jgi:hypothetical protein
MFANRKPVKAALLNIRNDTVSKETFIVVTKQSWLNPTKSSG